MPGRRCSASCLRAAAGGRFVVRVEDTDRERGSESFVAAQLDDLAWLGLDFDAGPGRDDGRGPYRQSERGGVYASFYERLERDGHAYPCFCTPAELEVARKSQIAAGEPPRYPGTCRGLDDTTRAARMASGRKAALRFAIPGPETLRFEDLVRGPQAVEAATIGDFLVRRADGGAVFFFCNAVDDALMGVTHVLRGDDHLSNTPRQLLVLRALGLPAPHYGHLPLLLDAGGAPQSKRRGSVTVAALRGRGYLAAALGNYLLRLGHHGAPDDWVDPANLPRNFHVDKLGRAPAHFDPVQLDHWQREAVRRLDPRAAAQWLAAEFPPEWTRREARVGRCPAAGQRAPAGRGARLVRGARRHAAAAAGGGGESDRRGRAGILRRGARDLWRDRRQPRARSPTGSRRAPGARARRSSCRSGSRSRGRHDGPELALIIAAMPQALVRDRLAAASRLEAG